MKTFVCNRPYHQWEPQWGTGEGQRVLPLTLLPDTAASRPGFPVFLPQYSAGWHVEIMPAVRICRLGRHIDPHFASRHVDAIGLVGCIMPSQAAALPNELMRAFDGALILGEMVPLEWNNALEISLERTNEPSPQFPTEAADTPRGCHRVVLPFECLHLTELLAAVGKCCTMRSGDLLLPCSSALRLQASIGLNAKVCLNGSEILNIKLR